MKGPSKGFWLGWGVGVLMKLSFWAGVIYVAIHFIHKFW